jgi:hypothetical protein
MGQPLLLKMIIKITQQAYLCENLRRGLNPTAGYIRTNPLGG